MDVAAEWSSGWHDDSQLQSRRGVIVSAAPTSIIAAARAKAESLKPRFDRADGLVALAQQYARGKSSRTPFEVVVTVPAAVLQNRAPEAERVAGLDDGGGIIGETARRLACDAGIVTMIEGDDGQPLNVGRRTRSIPSALWRALLRRDPCCRFPGCTNRLWLEGHHVKHWANGGETKLTNMALLCSRHHRYVHEYGYRIEVVGESELRFFDPRGREVKAVPDRVTRDDMGLPHIVHANRDLGIVPHSCRWNGEPVQYRDVCRVLYLVDQGKLSPDQICGTAGGS